MNLKKQYSGVVLQFTESMAALLSAGLSVQDSLAVCADISGKKQLKTLCSALHDSLIVGEHFHTALSRFMPAFSPLYISLVKIGESTGSAEKVFRKLGSYLKRKRDMQRKIVQALAYPAIVCVTAFFVAFFIMIFVMPKLMVILEAFNTETPLNTFNNDIDSAAVFLRNIIIAVLLIFVTILTALKLRSSASAFLLILDKILLKLPGIGNMIKTFCTSDFAFSMEMLCVSGISFVSAMEQSRETVSNAAFKAALARVITDVSEGMPLASAFKKQKVFPDYVTSWISIGEKTGSVESVFTQIHAYFEHESSEIATTLVTSAEPVFILLSGSVIIFLVWRLVLPIFSLIGGL
ncbi:type II secretion system protein [Spirochaetia bacterium]|nr:type II secretion system protein [Spirochaetia bacterium]